MVMKKTISVVVPCYNEGSSIYQVRDRVRAVFEGELSRYDYELIYVDDYSTDNTRAEIENVCSEDKRCRAVFNARNFGFHRNVFNSFFYASGDAVFMMFGDLQDPPEMLPQFVEKWEQGHQCVVGQRTGDTDTAFMRFMRGSYYRMIDTLSGKQHLHNMDGYGLYDREFINVLEQIREVEPYLKSVIEEYGMNLCVIPYEQKASGRGHSNFNFWKNYDFAMHGLTSSTKLLMRLATFIGLSVGALSFIYAMYVFIRKLIEWDSFPLGLASIMVAVTILGSVQLFFVGVLGEYILSINERVVSKPRVVISKKIGFDREIMNQETTDLDTVENKPEAAAEVPGKKEMSGAQEASGKERV